jgi:hypothetical protein
MAEEETTLDTIRDLKRRDPFTPFAIVMTSGDRYRIENGDSLAIASSQLHYYPPRSGVAISMRINQIAAIEAGEHRSRRRRV